MNRLTIQLFLAFLIAGTAAKLLLAPGKGRWLTLFGYVSRSEQPKLFRLCLLAGALVLALLTGLFVTQAAWLPMLGL